jgi:hypothetical protein
MIILYSIDTSSRCLILKQLLKTYNIAFEEKYDIVAIAKAGFKSLPVLEINNKMLSCERAHQWLKDNYVDK